MKVDYPAFLTKLALLGLIFAICPFPWSLPLAMFLTWGYMYAVALVYGVHVMPSMDAVCFLGNDDTRINFISFTVIEKH
jgi:hypothetical protein